VKIKLFCREIEIIKVDGNANHLNPHYSGRAVYDDTNRIYADGSNTFQTILHEVKHFWDWYAGIESMEQTPQEVNCNIFGFLVDQLMLENGADIFQRLKEFAEK
jgi:hypothetical protein